MSAVVANFDTRSSLDFFEDQLRQTLIRDNPICPIDCLPAAVRSGMYEYRWSRDPDRAKAALDVAQGVIDKEMERRMQPYNPPPRAA